MNATAKHTRRAVIHDFDVIGKAATVKCTRDMKTRMYIQSNSSANEIQGVKKVRRHHSNGRLMLNKAFRYHNILLF